LIRTKTGSSEYSVVPAQAGTTEYLLILQLNMANKNLGGVFDSRILEVRLDTFGFALEFEVDRV
jgi:hypothetical protein